MGQIFKSGLVCLAILCILSIGHGATENPPTETECRPHIEKALKKAEGTDENVNIADVEQVNDGDDNDSNENTLEDDVVTDEAESNEDDDQPSVEKGDADDNDADDNDADENDDIDETDDQDNKSDDETDDQDNKSDDDTDDQDNKSDEKPDEENSTEDQTEGAEEEIDDVDSKEEEVIDGAEPVKEDSKEESIEDGANNAGQDSGEDATETDGSGEEGDNKSTEKTVQDSKELYESNPDVIESVDRKTLQVLINDVEHLAVFFYDDKCASCPGILEELETIDDDTDDHGIQFVKSNDVKLAHEIDIFSFPALVYYENGVPIMYDGNLQNEERVLQWLIEQKSNDDGDDKDDGKDSKEAVDDDDDDSKEEAVEKVVEKKIVSAGEQEPNSIPEDDLLIETEIPKVLRTRDHIDAILHLDSSSVEKEQATDKAADATLKELKKIYENAIKPLETLYKYRDLSNRHFGDPEIFSKPLLLLMGPYSGGKSTIVNYLTDNEYTDESLRTGAEPSPAYFNILMHGEEPEVLDGTQMAADWTFSGLQKFGQGLQDRLRGHKLPSKLLEKVNIVEIPGILEVRKQVSKLFPFNDACQWFIDRADIILLVYDPAKLDAGPETEAILDQLKGREYQTRIILNKGDQIKAEELLRVQGALIWNISPLMSSAQPPAMYTVSLWSHLYEEGAPIRLLQAHERALLQDLRIAINQRIDNKIASARRFAVRVRNHAKMVDCYLTTYYNHKGLFSNKKKVSGDIIENPQNYHIFEGLATLTNISRYDLPDPNAYREFFRLNPLYEFKKLSETCTYFRGCPINKLDIAIAYDLPELVGRNKKAVELALNNLEKNNSGSGGGGGSSSSNNIKNNNNAT